MFKTFNKKIRAPCDARTSNPLLWGGALVAASLEQF